MRAAGMRIGYYLSPADQHFPDSSPDYDAFFKSQLTELLTNYGPVHEIYLTGDRSLTSLDWKGMAVLAKQLQPNILVWIGPENATTGADIRYVGNQSGRASRTTSSIANVPNGGPADVWYPADAPLSDRGSSWFWHPDGTVISLDSLKTSYLNTVGMNATLILNVPPSTTGQFDTADVSLLQQFGTWYSSLYKTNLLRNQTVTGDSTWASAGFDASNAIDDDVCTYWAAASGKTTARLEVTPASPITFQIISIREPIELGERSTRYHVEFKQNGSWNTAPTDASGAQIQGTVIGERQLWQLNSTTAEAVALVVDSARDVPAIAEFGAY
jgi:alpha-L-fucosidase